MAISTVLNEHFIIIRGNEHFLKSNARDTTNFTTKCLQTDMASYVEVPHQQLKYQITNSTLTFNINSH